MEEAKEDGYCKENKEEEEKEAAESSKQDDLLNHHGPAPTGQKSIIS